ncbi:alkaline-phosphatase-like protein, partial [Piptocephalis cylindrospora]
MSRSPVASARLTSSVPLLAPRPPLFLALIAHLLLLGYALFVFTRGFLLSRIALPDVSSCSNSPVPGSWPSPPSSQSSSAPVGCWSSRPPPYKHALILLVDALRFDFTLYDPSLSEPIPPYRNKLPIMQHLLDTQPRRALRYQFLADPPTTTLQRLKALSTGTLPTFIDAGSNFGGSSILEDSWLTQAALANRSASFVGDDTWLSLFPDVFRLSHPYPSLNVWDLHTVDEGVLAHLPSMMESKEDTILLGHFLGVDHCGHRHGPSHPAMAAKLKQMNTVLTDILASIDNDTIVFIFGDHGMDGKGDHGGDSRSELEAALFIYSGRDLDERGEEFDHLLRDMDQQRSHRSVAQVDLVPTLAMALGLPIPFGSLGSIIPEI